MKIVIILCIAIAAVSGIGEMAARWYLGLGDPPLTIRDPEIEYMFAPSRCYTRFHNLICYNRWSMRSDDFPSRKTNLNERRILVLGDSVINGGSLTDQSRLATTLLQGRLAAALQVPIAVGNVSSGSWGPANLLAYTRKFGWFDADLAVIVLSSDDLHDVPTFRENLGPDFPTEMPTLALEEAIVRYLPHYLPSPLLPQPFIEASDKSEDHYGPLALRELLDEATRSVSKVVVLLHPTTPELVEGFRSTADQIEAIANGAGVNVVRMDKVLVEAGDKAYRDGTHINNVGQELYAEHLTCLVLQELANGACTLPSPYSAASAARSPPFPRAVRDRLPVL